MYAGHFAAALAIKAAEPKAPTWALALGAGFIDLLFGLFVILNIEGYTPDRRFFIPWSHSLLACLIWAGLYAAMFLGRSWRVRAALAGAVVSHWLLDTLTHQPDLPLWPNGPDLGMRALFGGVSGWGEAAIVLAGLGLYVNSARKSSLHGRYWPAAIGLVLVTFGLGLTQG